MGMFDNLTCKYPLPEPKAQELLFQTKDTESQCLDHYEIRADGTLWFQDYDVEDRSDKNAAGLGRFAGCMTRINQRWIAQPQFTGEIVFYACLEDNDANPPPHRERTWVEFSAYFKDGVLQQLNQLKNRI